MPAASSLAYTVLYLVSQATQERVRTQMQKVQKLEYKIKLKVLMFAIIS